MPKGANAGASPTPEDEKLEEGADQATDSNPESSTGNDDAAAPSADPSDTPSEGAAEKPAAKPKGEESPLDKLRQRLVGAGADAEDEPEDDAEGVEPEATAEDEPEEEAPAGDDAGKTPKADAAPKGAAKPPESTAAEDPLKDFSAEDRAKVGRKAGARIQELNTKWRDEERKRKAEEPLVRGGRVLQKYLDDRKVPLEPKEAIAALEFAKLYKRGDQAAVDALEESLAGLKADLGLPESAAEEEVAPFDGELPASMQQLVDLGAKEDDVRLLAAVRQRKADRERAAKAAPRQEQRREPQRRAAPAQRQQPAPRAPAASKWGYSPQSEALAAESVIGYLKAQNVPDAELEAYFDRHITPRLAKHATGNDITSIPPEDRLRLVQIAQHAVVIERAQKAKQQRDAARPVSGGTSPTPRTASSSKEMTPIERTRLKMVGKR